MPRKNTFDSSVVSSLLLNQIWSNDWRIISIKDQSHDHVIRFLQESLIFLSFGHPEGFGLPVAEAMACGCSVVGFTGLGGNELFNIAKKYDLSNPVDYGDWMGFVNGVNRTIAFLRNNQAKYSLNVRSLSNEIRNIYNLDSMKRSLAVAISTLPDVE